MKHIRLGCIISEKYNLTLNLYRRCVSTIPLTTVTSGQARSDKVGTIYSDDVNEATLYIHWPFCKQLCSFCNFNKYVRNNVEHKRMRKCLIKELESLIRLAGVERIKSVYFGGGTPSLAEPATIYAVLNSVNKLCKVDKTTEVTLEANPTSAETDKLREFRSAGINRISLGIQSLSTEDLQQLGRDNSVEESLRSLETTKMLFPSRVSIDLIFGRPGQTVEKWQNELCEALSLCDRHVSLYQLTVEKGTALYKDVRSGKVVMPNSDMMADLYKVSIETLASNGFHRYEVANFAKPGAESQHNMAYWNGSQYIGIGPGAHGRFYITTQTGHRVRQARIQVLEPMAWMEEVEQHGHGTRKITTQSQHEILEELLMLGLRTSRGLTSEIWMKFNRSATLQDIFGSSTRLKHFIAEGFLEVDERGIRATACGLTLIDGILPEVMTQLNEYYMSHFPTG